VSVDAPSRGEQYGQEQPAPKMAATFPASARLLKHSDFERVYKQGRRHFSPHMTVFYLARSESSPNHLAEKPGALAQKPSARVGLTVGRALGGAVQRNRIKRRLREAVRMQRSMVKQPLDVVINPKKSVLTLEFGVILEEIGRAFDVIGKSIEKRTANH
jgi:ribonuclease P protein component